MMIKIFTKNKNGKIEISEKELKELLDTAYWDGYNANKGWTYTYATPGSPYYWSTSTGDSTTITLKNSDYRSDSTGNSTTVTLNNSGYGVGSTATTGSIAYNEN